ncbi:translation initiation factor IF-2-like [Passer montanus]|uniref:translation initiation factor IF-2-like n=1 Tax=Passer montanus TaxID=9160 RepID=UPI00195F9D2C|nr:translation initiation factor IF-2-like [Passer montanus]
MLQLQGKRQEQLAKLGDRFELIRCYLSRKHEAFPSPNTAPACPRPRVSAGRAASEDGPRSPPEPRLPQAEGQRRPQPLMVPHSALLPAGASAQPRCRTELWLGPGPAQSSGSAAVPHGAPARPRSLTKPPLASLSRSPGTAPVPP